jgi:hypothetical protein
MDNKITNDEYLKKKNFDHISFRIEFIKDVLNGKSVEPMIDLDKCETENFVNKPSSSDGEDNNDIRKILHKKYFDFNKIINQIGGKLLYIKSGSTGHTFKGLDPDDDEKINYAVKIVAYPKKENYGDLYDISRPENAELMMLKVLSYFVINNHTPHIVLPICTFNTNIKTFVNLPKNNIVNNKKYDQFVKRQKKKEYYDNVSVLISEWANAGDLLDYIRINHKTFKLRDWRVLFFQVLSVLAVVQEKYPSFRHNDLKANNLLIQTIESRNKNNKFKYKINGSSYIVPNIGFQIKLWDFDFACIPGIVENSKVSAEWTDRINVKPEQNRYYDVHYFFNTLTRKGFFPEFFTSELVHKKAKDFVKRILPDNLRSGKLVAERGRLLKNLEYTTPDNILKTDPFFEKMRVKKKKETKDLI